MATQRKPFSTVIFLSLLLVASKTDAQTMYETSYESDATVKVYVSDYESDADLVVYKTEWQTDATGNRGIWYMTKWKSDADNIVYFTDWKSDADIVIYYSDYESDAGWKKKDKKSVIKAHK